MTKQIEADGHRYQRTHMDDVADIGGTLIAYIAWKHSANQPPASIDGYTPDRRFFIGMAQVGLRR